MYEFKKNTGQELQEVINNSFSKKLLFSNYYGVNLSDVDYLQAERTLIIRKVFDGFSRLYVLSDNEPELTRLLSEMPSVCAMNIPSKKDINDWRRVIESAGFKPAAIFRRYFYTSFRKRGDFKRNYAQLTDIKTIRNLLFEHFSPITGHLPADEKLKDMIENKQILVNRNRTTGEVEGIIGFSIEKTKCYLPFWIDLSGLGLSLLFNLFNMVIENKIGSVNFWVNDENVETIGIHKKLGAQPDGLVDYVFTK